MTRKLAQVRACRHLFWTQVKSPGQCWQHSSRVAILAGDPGYPRDIFLSHRGLSLEHGTNNKDEYVSLLDRDLRRCGYSTFLDKTDLHAPEPGAPERIDHALISSSLVILVLSPSFAKSQWCLREMALALDVKPAGKILPVRLSEDAMQDLYQGIEACGAPEPEKQQWRKAARVLHNISAIVLGSNTE